MVAEQLNMLSSNKEGWITGALMRMSKKGTADVSELAIAYPVGSSDMQKRDEVVINEDYKVCCYGYYENQASPEIYCANMEDRFREVIDDFKPDVIHVFGTEYGHTLSVARILKERRENNADGGFVPKLLIGIQGIIYRCGEEYTANLPKEIVHSRTFRDIIKKDNIASQQAKFLERGEREIEAIALATDVTGRTEFDKSIVEEINPDVNYHFMNETLREPFYTGTWDVTECDRHTIFVSQADYPLKGFHILLDAMPMLMERYGDVRIRVAGANIAACDTLKQKIKISGYGKYIRALIKAYHLKDQIEFLGRLNADEMKAEYLRCHTYVCPSSLENSPNSMGEAMLLGVPVVASKTGGIPSMINDDEEGKLFTPCNSDALADSIIYIWENDGIATEMGAAAMNRARATHNADNNYHRLIEIYRELLGSN